MTLLWLGIVVLAMARARAALVRSRLFVGIVHRLAALAFFALACRLATEER
jgi:threonine/homoserine/homoserine lactone efflux protein